MMSLDEYLSQPCDFCDRVATHNQGQYKFCNQHLLSDVPTFARND